MNVIHSRKFKQETVVCMEKILHETITFTKKKAMWYVNNNLTI